MKFLYAFVCAFINLFIPGLGSDDWQERKFYHQVVENLTLYLDCDWPVENAIKNDTDTEIRKRCRLIYERYNSVYVSPSLRMYDIPVKMRKQDVWAEANKLSIGEDTPEYARLLMHRKLWTRQQLRIYLMEVELKVNTNKCIEYVNKHVGEVQDYFFPPPPQINPWGCGPCNLSLTTKVPFGKIVTLSILPMVGIWPEDWHRGLNETTRRLTDLYRLLN